MRAGSRSFRCVVADAWPVFGTPGAAPARGVSGRRDVALADLPAFDLVRREQAGTAPALQCCGELPGEIDCFADTTVHAEPAGRNDEVHRVTGEEDTAFAETLRQQQVLPPFGHREHLVADRH